MKQSYIITVSVIAIAIIVGMIVFYRSARGHLVRTDFQIVQHAETTDFYALFKASEYMAHALAETVASEEFLFKALQKNTALKALLPQDPQERLRVWNTMVSIDDVTVHGKFSLYVRGDDPQMIRQLARDITDIIEKDNGMYQGEDVQKRKIVIVKNEDGDVVEEYEENDGDVGAHITIRKISGPFLLEQTPLYNALFAMMLTIIVLGFLVYLYHVARRL